MSYKEEIEYIKENIKIIDFAKDNGFTVIKKGKYYSLKEHDSVIIDPAKNCYWQNSVPGSGSSIGQGGSIFDFAMNLLGMSFRDCINYFSNQVDFKSSKLKPIKKEELQQKNNIDLPPKNNDNRNVFAYLVKTRCIDKKVVRDFIKRDLLYQDTNNNCVFVSYENNKPVFATRRGTNTEKKFFGDVSGSDYSKCFFVDNKSNYLCITESVIDAMSIITLSNDNKCDYLALGGVGKWKAIDTYLKNSGYKKVFIALDNDEPGETATNIIKDYLNDNYPNIETVISLPSKDYGKDWNEFLVNKRKERGEPDAIRKIR